MTQPQTVTPADVLGPLNGFELKAAPRPAIPPRRCVAAGGWPSRRGGGIPAGVVRGAGTGQAPRDGDEQWREDGGRSGHIAGPVRGDAKPEPPSCDRGEASACVSVPARSAHAPVELPPAQQDHGAAVGATLIVEAATNSGTRHQGWEAIRLGRPVLFPKRSLERQSPDWADDDSVGGPSASLHGRFRWSSTVLPPAASGRRRERMTYRSEGVPLGVGGCVPSRLASLPRVLRAGSGSSDTRQ